jgi:methionine synthase II (cobalamin-independent)
MSRSPRDQRGEGIWRSGTATGIGSLPGDDPVEASRLVLGELSVPHLPELPQRGAHADLAGRGAALLHDLHVDLQPSGWRMVPRPSRDGRRAKDLLARDLDALEEAGHADAPAYLKVQATGPWTLASLLELHRGDRVLADAGAVADLADSLAEGLRLHVADVQRRFPGATVALQLDEPGLPAVQLARVPTSSGFGTLRVPKPSTVSERLTTVLAATEHTVLHCCAANPPLALLAQAGAISIDGTLPYDEQALGEAVERGTGLLLGVVPATGTEPTAVRGIVEIVRRLRDRVGVTDVTLTPTCGLAGATPDYARAVLKRLAEAAAEVAGD